MAETNTDRGCRGCRSAPTARMCGVNLAQIAWLATVIGCLVAVLILAIRGDYGYAMVTFAVALAAAVNLF